MIYLYFNYDMMLVEICSKV